MGTFLRATLLDRELERWWTAGTQKAYNSTAKGVSAQLLYVCITARQRSRGCSQNLCSPFLRAAGLFSLFTLITLPVATALLVEGSTQTFWISPFVSISSYSSVVKALGCSCNCRRLAYGSFQLTQMSHDDHTVQLIEPWWPRRRQNVITVLTTLPQG